MKNSEKEIMNTISTNHLASLIDVRERTDFNKAKYLSFCSALWDETEGCDLEALKDNILEGFKSKRMEMFSKMIKHTFSNFDTEEDEESEEEVKSKSLDDILSKLKKYI